MNGERVLVAYASKHGATAEIAERIAAVLKKHELAAEAVPVNDVDDVAGYAACVLGIAVYMGRWRKEAIRFLTQNEERLSRKPFWLFTSGPSGEGDPVELVHGFTVPASQRGLVDRIRPRDIAVFHGSLRPDDLNGFERWIIRRVKARTGDFRDWQAIDVWAASIPAALAEVH